MMRPTTEQILEYVRGGETDPDVGEMLKHDPDAEAKLREARFICGMISRQPTPDSDRTAESTSEALTPMLDMEVAALRSPERPSRRASLRMVEPPDGRHQVRDVMHSVMSYGPPGQDLGAVIAEEGDRVYVLSHEPLIRPKEIEAVGLAAIDEQIKIGWGDFRIWLPQSIASDRPLKARVTHSKDEAPVEGMDVAFMPVSGPFQRTRTNERGVAKLVPVQDGVMRFAGNHVGLLRIERKKQA